MKQKKEHWYNGVKYASKEEITFKKWVDRLTEEGKITFSHYQPKTFELCPKTVTPFFQEMKTKIKEGEKSLMHSLTYTPDWLILFSPDFFYSGIFLDVKAKMNIKEGKKPTFVTTAHDWWVDVKGSWALHQSQKFPVVQKVLLENEGKFVQKVIVKGRRIFAQIGSQKIEVTNV